MSWRIVSVSSVSKLDYKMDYLVIRNVEETKRIHLSEISILIIESTAVSLTAYLLCELSKWNILVILCDEKRLPYGIVSQLYGSHDTSYKYRMQSKWDEEIKAKVWQAIVKAKIKSQSVVIENLERRKLLEAYINQVEPKDLTNREGHAAKVYFNSAFGMNFIRGNDELNINKALDFGYSILLSAFSREVVSCGYCTQIGLFHDNMFNNFNLASDLMEPFRTYIDIAVKEMELITFAHNEKKMLVNTLNRKIVIDNRSQYILQAIKIYTKSVFQAIESRDISIIKFPDYDQPIYETDSIL